MTWPSALNVAMMKGVIEEATSAALGLGALRSKYDSEVVGLAFLTLEKYDAS